MISYKNFDFSGGLNIEEKNAQIAQNENVLSQNFISNGKAIEVLSGYVKFNKTPISNNLTNKIKSIFRFVKPSSPNIKRFIADCGDGLWVANETTAEWDPIETGLDPQGIFEYTVLGDNYCFMVNGYDGLKKYNGTSIYNVNGAPNGTTVSNHFNRLLIGGNLSYPNRVYWSEPAQPDEWDSLNNYQELPSINGDGIVKIIPFMDGSILFKTHSIWLMYGNMEPFPINKISDNIGCASKQSVTVYGDKVFWFSDTKHIYCYDRTNLMNITEFNVGALPVPASKIEDVCCEVIDGDLWVSYCDESSNESFNNRVLICDIRNINHPKWFGPHKGFQIQSFCNFKAKNDTGKTYFGDSNTSTVWQKSTNYYMGANLQGTIVSSSTTTTDVKLEKNGNIGTNTLTGCRISIVDGKGQGQQRIIIENTQFNETGAVWSGSITVNNDWNDIPDSTSRWEIGTIDAKYRTGILSFESPEKQKLFDKVFIHTESKGDYLLKIGVIKNHLDSGNEYNYSLLGSSTIWDSSVWDQSEFSSPDMLDDYIDLDFENAKYLNLEFSVKGRNRSCLIYGFVILFRYGDTLDFDGS